MAKRQTTIDYATVTKVILLQPRAETTLEYIMSVEEVFKVEISDEDAEKLTTVGETQAYLQDKSVLYASTRRKSSPCPRVQRPRPA